MVICSFNNVGTALAAVPMLKSHEFKKIIYNLCNLNLKIFLANYIIFAYNISVSGNSLLDNVNKNHFRQHITDVKIKLLDELAEL